MTAEPVETRLDRLPSGRTVARLRLTHAARCNALNPDLLAGLADGLETAAEAGAPFIALTAEGRHFSTGGDVARFHDAAKAGNVTAYADDVVGRLQAAVLAMRRSPAIIVLGAQGAVTGGSAGLVFAADLVLLAEDAFIQPYYREVGFAPDGGWCALLPGLIGPRRALALQLENRRLSAAEAVSLGLADRVVPPDELDAALGETLAGLDECADPTALSVAKALIWDEPRLAELEARLDAEARAFAERIALPATLDGMAAFLGERQVSGV